MKQRVKHIDDAAHASSPAARDSDVDKVGTSSSTEPYLRHSWRARCICFLSAMTSHLRKLRATLSNDTALRDAARQRTCRAAHRGWCLATAFLVIVLLSSIAFFILLFVCTEYVMLASAMSPGVPEEKWRAPDLRTAAAPLVSSADGRFDVIGTLRRHFVIPLHAFFAHLLTQAGVDLAAYERELLDYVEERGGGAVFRGVRGLDDRHRRDWGADAHGSARRGGLISSVTSTLLAHDMDACVAVHVGNASLQSWDPLTSPPSPLLPSAASPPFTRGGSSRAAYARVRRALERDSTVLLLFNRLRRWPDSNQFGKCEQGNKSATSPAVVLTVKAGAEDEDEREDYEDEATGATNPGESDVDARKASSNSPTPSHPFAYTRRSLDRAFREVAAVFVASRHTITPCPTATAALCMEKYGPPFVFAEQQRATWWELFTDVALRAPSSSARNNSSLLQQPPAPTAATGKLALRDRLTAPVTKSEEETMSAQRVQVRRFARPLRVDLVITYVNPHTPSFAAATREYQAGQQQQHAHRSKERTGRDTAKEDENNVRGKRMRDWGELRHALRSVDHYVAHSPAMRHYTGQLRRDAQLLMNEMGVEVKEKDIFSGGVDVLPTQGENGEAERPASPGHNNSSSTACAADNATISLIGSIYLVVADRDQVPAWAKAGVLSSTLPHPLHVVTHAELLGRVADAVEKVPGEVTAELSSATQSSASCLFYGNQSGAALHGATLPTFNSRVIESLLHHIPGLSRFYLYLNNDILFGQAVTPFDLMRPLAPARQELRFAGYQMLARRVAPVVQKSVFDTSTPEVDSHNARPQRKQRQRAERAALFFEPILHREAMESLWQPSVQDTVFAAAARTSLAESKTSAFAHCRNSSSSSNTTTSKDRVVSMNEAAAAVAACRARTVQRHLDVLRRASVIAMHACSARRAQRSKPVPSYTPAAAAFAGAASATASTHTVDSGLGALEQCVALTTNQIFQHVTRTAAIQVPPHRRHAVTQASASSAASLDGVWGSSGTLAPVLTGFATRPLFRVPPWSTQHPHGRQQWATALEYVEGVTPTLIHPHSAVLLDRAGVRDVVERVLRAETAILRRHRQRRDTGEYIPAAAFVLAAVGQRRWLDRQLWAAATAAEVSDVDVDAIAGTISRVQKAESAASLHASTSGNTPAALTKVQEETMTESQSASPSREAPRFTTTLLEPYFSPSLRSAVEALAPHFAALQTADCRTNTTAEDELLCEAWKLGATLPEAASAHPAEFSLHARPSSTEDRLSRQRLGLKAERAMRLERQRRTTLQRAFADAARDTRLEFCRPQRTSAPSFTRSSLSAQDATTGVRPGEVRQGAQDAVALRMDDLGPLYGDLHGVHSQHPLLFDHLASWWVPHPISREARPLRASEKDYAEAAAEDNKSALLLRPRSSSVDGCGQTNVLRMAPRVRHDLLHFPIVLRRTLPLPQLYMLQPPCPSHPDPKMTCEGQLRLVEQHSRAWKALYLDVDYHWRDGWPTEEVDDDAPWRGHVKAASSPVDTLQLVTLTSHAQAKDLVKQYAADAAALRRPVQCTFNDDFAVNGAALDAINASMDRLFDTFNNHAPKSRWEL